MRIAVSRAGEETRTYVVGRERLRIGRHSSNDVVIASPEVSLFHGEVLRAEHGLEYRDLGSTNGSLVRRGVDVYPVPPDAERGRPLQDGDEILLGEERPAVVLRVERAGVPAPARASAAGEAIFVAGRDALERYSEDFGRDALLALLDFSSRTTRGVDPETLLTILAESALRLFRKANHVEVHLRDPHGEAYRPALARDRRGEAGSSPVSRTVMERVLERGEALIFTDLEPGFDAAESLKRRGVRAGMCAPLWDGEEVIGFVQVDRRKVLASAFGAHDLALLAVFAHLAALGITNARLQAGLRDNVTELREARAKMERLAFYDSLTGLENRALFLERLRQAVHVARRHGVSTALLYVDLDQFKWVNDTLGHDAGDRLLETVAERLRACVREVDTVARIGGDEFAVLVMGVEDTAGTTTVARKILSSLSLPVRLPGRELTPSASIGITLTPRDGTDETLLLKNADLAMYRAKAQGRNRSQFFTEELNREVEQGLQLESALRTGLRDRQFRLFYQPVVRIPERSLVGLEALMRWEHPERGLVGADEFIPASEHTGIITGLGEWALVAACEYARRLAARGLSGTGVAVNLSVRQLQDPEITGIVLRAIERTGMAPGDLTLEITESMLMEDVAEIAKVLGRLKDLGVRLSIDDFGTGYSSISHLRRYPIDILKLDRSFVRGIPGDSGDCEITAGVLAMAAKLHLSVIAEGVETPEQEAFLRENGCELGQGFLYGRPVSGAELARRLGLPAPGPRSSR